MSDDTQDDTPVLIGDPLEPDEMTEQLTVSQQDMEDAVDYWNSVASDLFFGALGV
jgi:hypothetical protein